MRPTPSSSRPTSKRSPGRRATRAHEKLQLTKHETLYPQRLNPGWLIIIVVATAALLGLNSGPIFAAEDIKPAAPVQAKLYLMARITVAHDAGIVSIPMGSPVTLVEKVAGGMKVRLRDGTAVVVTADQVSEDSALAQKLADQEKAEQASIAMGVQAKAEAQAAADAAQKQKDEAAARDYLREVQKNAATAPVVTTASGSGMKGSALDENPRVVATVKPRKRPKK